MKKLTLSFGMLAITLSSFAQVKEFTTKKLLTTQGLGYLKYDIKMYKDSITVELKGGLGTARLIKAGNVKVVYISKLNTKEVGGVKVNTYQTEDARVIITDTGKRIVVAVDIKDTFTGAITKLTYL